MKTIFIAQIIERKKNQLIFMCIHYLMARVVSVAVYANQWNRYLSNKAHLKLDMRGILLFHRTYPIYILYHFVQKQFTSVENILDI